MDLQSMGGKPVTSENVSPRDNFRAYSPQIADAYQLQPDTPASNSRSPRRTSTSSPTPLIQSDLRESRVTLNSPSAQIAISALTPSSLRVASPTAGDLVGSAVDARSAAACQLENLSLGHHGRVARRGHRQRAVRGAVLHRGLQRLAGQQAVDQSGRERGAAPAPGPDLPPPAGGGPGGARG